MKGEEKVLEFADELTEEQMFAVNGGGRFSSSSSSGSSSSGRSSNSSRGGSRSSGSGNSKKSSGSSIGSRIGSAVSSIGSKISNAFSGNKSGGSANTSDKKAESSYVPYKGLPGYTPPTRTDGAESKKSSVQAGGTATAAPAVTRTTNGSADNPPSAMSGSPSTYLTRQPESVSPAVTGLTGSPSTYLSKQPVVSGSGNKYSGGSSSFSSSGSSSSSASSSSNSSIYSNVRTFAQQTGAEINRSANDLKEKANNLVRNVGKTSEQVLNYGKDMFYNVRENFSGNIKNNVDSFLNRGQGLNNQTKKSEPLEEKSPVSQVIVANEERTHGEWTNIDSKKDKFQYNLTQGKYANAGDEEKNGMMNGTSCEKYTVNVDSYEEIGDDGVIYVKSPKNGEKETIEVPVFNTFDKYGCKMTSAAVIVGLATGKNIDILDINDCDENRDGLFTMSECKAAFEKYLGNESEVSCKRYENVEGSSNTFSKETFDNIVESEDEVYVIARATSGHWIVLTGYNLDKDTNKLEFEYKGSSTNDIRYNRKYVLGNDFDKKNSIYGIDCIEVYAVKHKNEGVR